jgi:hypothetical protein
MVPRLELPPGTPFTSHVMLAPVATQKNEVKICICPRDTFAAGGKREPVALQVIVTLALPDFELSAALVAVTATMEGEGGVAGAM